MEIDWVGTVLGTLFLWMLHYIRSHGHQIPGNFWVRTILALMGGIFLAFSVVGWLILAGFALMPVVIAGGSLIIAIVVAVVDIGWKRNADKYALIAFVALPVLFLAAHGPIASPGAKAVTEIHATTETNFGRLLGG